jgi:hypothetical protein
MKNSEKNSIELSSRSHIGVATMEENGEIVLRLRADLDGEGVGEASFRYKKNTLEYTDILEHLGGLNPGESKQVPSWPDSPEPDTR